MEVLQTSALPLGYVAPPSKLDSMIPAMSQEFRDAMARLPAGVVVVSTTTAGGYRGLTASSLISISLDPPMVLVGFELESATRAAVMENRWFGVSVLSRAQEFIAERFAGRAPAVDPQWRDIPHRITRRGLPLVEGSTAWLECWVDEAHQVGDHEVVFATVESASLGEGDPLILWDRSFWTLR